MEGEHPERMECFKCKRKRLLREKTLKRPFLEEEPRKRKRSKNGTLVIEERNGQDRMKKTKYLRHTRKKRPVEDEKPSIEEEEDPWRPMKNFVDGIIEHLHDDLENQWNLRMEQNIGVGLDLPRVEMGEGEGEGEDPPPELPEDLKVRIRELNGTRPILVLEKQLFKTDINEGENRLSMPLNQIRREFLSEEEKMRVVEGMQVKLIQPSLEETTVTFKKWKMKESCHLYVFTREWKLIVNDNSLEARTRIQVWSFRVGSELWFALVRVNP
ncbi:hypothetical protein AAG906_012930 [Vitis piasezkii]